MSTQEQYFLVNVYARGLARDVKEQVNVYARGLARDVKEQYFLVNVYTVYLCKNSTLVNVYTVCLIIIIPMLC